MLILFSILILFLLRHIILETMVNYAALRLCFFAFSTIAVITSFILFNYFSSFDIRFLIVAIVCMFFSCCSILPFSVNFFNCFFCCLTLRLLLNHTLIHPLLIQNTTFFLYIIKLVMILHRYFLSCLLYFIAKVLISFVLFLLLLF